MPLVPERALAWIVAHPSTSHTLTGSLEMLMQIMRRLRLPGPEIVAAVLISTGCAGSHR
jgi:hypothetical protein